MAFLDNSGDVLLDMVLTDSGRARLARGDGSFKVAKFALGDDEIDYGLYDSNHPSGSAYADTEILSLPIFQAVTNDTTAQNSKLISIPRNDLMYLPVVKLSPNLGPGGGTYNNSGAYYVCVNQDTITSLGASAGVIDGQSVQTAQRTPIVLEQGLDTTEIAPSAGLEDYLRETQYLVSIDSRFGHLVSPSGQPKEADISFVNSDKHTFYFMSLGNGPYVTNIENSTGYSVISGPRGTMLKFGIKANMNLSVSSYLFDTLGSTVTISAVDYKYLDAHVHVLGLNTGYSETIKLRFLRKV
jgi:hypothetical protein